MFSTLEKIKELAQKQGISLQKVAEDLGYSINYLYTLKEKTPKSDRLQQIADYFNVSTDYLLGRTDNPSIVGRKSNTDDIDEIIANAMMFDGKPLTDDDKRAIRGIIAGYMSSKEN
ncbi:helix-turn-helix domain-containing protein [Streptococcus thermophilus]|uniref:helix-turn-helix domain-containing protein n=1 Tax=Streptococcus thermophilus TaxID=1308 RepID=UPI000824AAEB|nr:helix-turn-helix transcriptional regulator [Streptococcus thermophilus]AOD26534.1 transcriptional regulator [Streptococcus thermophilus]MCE2202076.1 helix-turn-helix domain-containing protein [Streptococcus thermophilus]MCE2208308.1 helix-turn-helix domain-containing protein [Streptococcus thermophilus]